MNVSMPKTRMMVATARFVLLAAAALALAACETTELARRQPMRPRRKRRPRPRPRQKPRQSPRQSLSRTEASKPETKPQAAKPAEPVADSEPMTHARAARECWMKTERTSAHADLDKRADLVNKCIDRK